MHIRLACHINEQDCKKWPSDLIFLTFYVAGLDIM